MTEPRIPPAGAEDPDDRQDSECSSCGETPENECSKSKRACGHHCNHSWDQDICHWCGTEFGEEADDV